MGKLHREADAALQVHYLSGPVAVADGGGEPAHPGDILVVRRHLQNTTVSAWRARARRSAFVVPSNSWSVADSRFHMLFESTQVQGG